MGLLTIIGNEADYDFCEKVQAVLLGEIAIGPLVLPELPREPCMGRPVRCVETGIIYVSVRASAAAPEVRDRLYDIQYALKHPGVRAGEYGYQWEYMPDGYVPPPPPPKRVSLERVENYLRTGARVRCITTGEVFPTVSAAARAANCSYSAVLESITKHRPSKKFGLRWEIINGPGKC